MWYNRKDSYTAQHANTYKEESIINYNSPLPVGAGGSNFTLSEFFLILRGFHLALHSFTPSFIHPSQHCLTEVVP